MNTKDKVLELLRQAKAELELAIVTAAKDEWPTATLAMHEAERRLKEADFKAGQLRQLYS